MTFFSQNFIILGKFSSFIWYTEERRPSYMQDIVTFGTVVLCKPIATAQRSLRVDSRCLSVPIALPHRKVWAQTALLCNFSRRLCSRRPSSLGKLWFLHLTLRPTAGKEWSAGFQEPPQKCCSHFISVIREAKFNRSSLRGLRKWENSLTFLPWFKLVCDNEEHSLVEN